MSEQDLELLVTIDDPGEDDLQEDTFKHLQAGSSYLPDEPPASWIRAEKQTEVIGDEPAD